MNPLEYLEYFESLIAGQKLSSSPVQRSELELLRSFMPQEREAAKKKQPEDSLQRSSPGLLKTSNFPIFPILTIYSRYPNPHRRTLWA